MCNVMSIFMIYLFVRRELFSTVIDMLATLIHSTLVSDNQSEKGDENRKTYQNLMKKLKKVRFEHFIMPLFQHVCIHCNFIESFL